MKESTNPAANDSPLKQTLFRGIIDQNSVAGANMDGIATSTLEYLRNAILAGDHLSNPKGVELANRRALIVASQYWEKHPGVDYPTLPSTINDAFYVHNMLVRHGYDPKNIRVLLDHFDDDGMSAPSGVNINKSLDWLVDGTQPGDYRFFHFAGHGIRINSEEDEGKRAQAYSVTRHHDSELSGPHGPIRKQTIPISEIAYYNEAMVASYRPRPWYSKVSDEEYSLIRDKRLNEAFARLPEGSLLTCVLDCCCSGRLIGNNTKLDGGGFRGRVTQASVPALQPVRKLSPIHTTLLPVPTSGEPHEGDYLTPNGGNVVMYEGLPGHEKARDQIKAMVITWSACHQLQEAGEILDSKSGILTRAFTETVRSIPFRGNTPPTIGDIFDRVQELVKQDASNLNRASSRQGEPPKEHVQYAQVWTSIKKDEEAEAFERLKQPFVI